ncbi:MAG: GNAT family N-acetyltransferase [Myxococcota bacterium]
MIGWFVAWFQRFVQLGIDLAAALIRGIVTAPFAGGSPRPTVRRADPAEVVDLRHRVLRPDLPRSTAMFDGDAAPDTRHWVAVLDGRIVGAVSVMRAAMPDPPADQNPPPVWQLRGMGVDDALRGTGVGALLLDAVHAEVAAPIWCNAREAVVGFYARAGWIPVGPVFEIAPIGPHRRMWWRP